MRVIWLADAKQDAEKAFDFLFEAYGGRYGKAVACLTKDCDALLAETIQDVKLKDGEKLTKCAT